MRRHEGGGCSRGRLNSQKLLLNKVLRLFRHYLGAIKALLFQGGCSRRCSVEAENAGGEEVVRSRRNLCGGVDLVCGGVGVWVVWV